MIAGGLIVASLVAVTSVEASPGACSADGVRCRVGMIGPRGGVVFYDAGSMQWWGRFLEAERRATPTRGAVWGTPQSIYGGSEPERRTQQRHAMSIGMGRANTAAMRAAMSPIVATIFVADQDWFLPSKDELDALYHYWRQGRPEATYGARPMWTSTESEDRFAWYQLFHDGTLFTDANGIIPRLASNKGYTASAKHTGSDFAPSPMHVVRVRAFPSPIAEPGPAPALVASPTDNPTCATSAIGCRIGDIGPAGGIVVYDAGTSMWWGRYLEIAPKSCEISGVAFARSTRVTLAVFPTAADRLATTILGAGASNTALLRRVTGPNTAAVVASDSRCGGRADWFLPSKGELNEAFRWLSHSRRGLQPTPAGQFERGYYWTSSDYNGSTAWTQYFADGQQFDRVQTLSRNRQPPARPFLVRPMRAFGEGVPG